MLFFNIITYFLGKVKSCGRACDLIQITADGGHIRCDGRRRAAGRVQLREINKSNNHMEIAYEKLVKGIGWWDGVRSRERTPLKR